MSKPSERIGEIYDEQVKRNDMLGISCQFVPGAAEKMVSAIVQYLDELHAKGILTEKWDGRIS